MAGHKFYGDVDVNGTLKKNGIDVATQTDVTNINNNITNINNNITDINSDITDINGDITNINNTVNSLSTEFDERSTYIGNQNDGYIVLTTTDEYRIELHFKVVSLSDLPSTMNGLTKAGKWTPGNYSYTKSTVLFCSIGAGRWHGNLPYNDNINGEDISGYIIKIAPCNPDENNTNPVTRNYIRIYGRAKAASTVNAMAIVKVMK